MDVFIRSISRHSLHNPDDMIVEEIATPESRYVDHLLYSMYKEGVLIKTISSNDFSEDTDQEFGFMEVSERLKYLESMNKDESEGESEGIARLRINSDEFILKLSESAERNSIKIEMKKR